MRKKGTDQHRFRLAHKYKYKYILLSDLCGAFHIQSQLLQQKQHHQLWKRKKSKNHVRLYGETNRNGNRIPLKFK